MKNVILVTGATGHLGGSIIKHLLKKLPADQIVALVRDEKKAAQLKENGIPIRIGDYHDPASLREAFVNVRKAVLISSHDLTSRTTQHENVVRAATLAGVRHIVYTGASLKDVYTSVLPNFMIDHFETEEHIKESGMYYTFMRNNLYAEMIPFYLGQQVLEKGVIFPGGDGRVPFALRNEMGEAIANVLTGEGHENRIYNISNDISYSFKDLAEILGDLSGKKITYFSPDQESHSRSLTAMGVSPQIVQIAEAFSTAMRNGDFDVPSSDLKMLLGRPPADLKLYLRKTYLDSMH